jgi:hypothetical protein
MNLLFQSLKALRYEAIIRPEGEERGARCTHAAMLLGGEGGDDVTLCAVHSANKFSDGFISHSCTSPIYPLLKVFYPEK